MTDSTRYKLQSVLDDILNKIDDDNAPSIGGDDTVIDLETDAKLIILAITQLHNKYSGRAAKRRGHEYTTIEITREEVRDLNRGGYSVQEWNRICKTLTNDIPLERDYNSEDDDIVPSEDETNE